MTSFSALQYSKELQAVGFSQSQAEVIAEGVGMNLNTTHDFATKKELYEVRDQLNEKIDQKLDHLDEKFNLLDKKFLIWKAKLTAWQMYQLASYSIVWGV